MSAKANAGGLKELGALRDALAQRARETEAAATRARDLAIAAEAERTLFAASVGRVLPLRRPPVPPPPPTARPEPVPRQRERDDRAVLAESIGVGVDAETLLETDDGLSYARRGVGADVVRKLRRGVWAIQAEIDLHGLDRRAARERLRAFLQEVAGKGLRCIRVVHGKGLRSPGGEGVLKADAKVWLARRAEVLAFTHARAADGGHGALIVLLRPRSG